MNAYMEEKVLDGYLYMSKGLGPILFCFVKLLKRVFVLDEYAVVKVDALEHDVADGLILLRGVDLEPSRLAASPEDGKR